MSIMESMFGNEDETPVDPVVERGMKTVLQLVKTELNPLVVEKFQDPKVFHLLLERVKDNPIDLVAYLENSSKFEDELNKDRRAKYSATESAGTPAQILGEEVAIPESTHADGQVRRAEKGPRVNMAEVIRRGIDPSKVLFFRVTQPGEAPKPEYYWTTDFYETQKGLTQEVSAEKRRTAVTLVADMQTIAGEQGLIQDVNDDNGLAVRQIGLEPFDQQKCLGVIRPPEQAKSPFKYTF